MRRQPHIHPIGCACRACAPTGRHSRAQVAVGAITRALVLLAALCAIPFILAWAMASNAGDRR